MTAEAYTPRRPAPVGIGAISRDGRSLALIELGGPDRQKIDALNAYGSTEAAEFLLEAVRGWARRPAESNIKISVIYENRQPRIGVRWPSGST